MLFQNSSARYMSWMFVFLINTVYPFLWIADYFKALPVTNLNKTLFPYKTGCILLSLLFQFITLIFVLAKNENVRKHGLTNMKRDEKNLTNSKKKFEDQTNAKRSLLINQERLAMNESSDNQVTQKDSMVKKLFVSSSVLLWSIVANHFVQNIQTSEIEKYPVGYPIQTSLRNTYALVKNGESVFMSWMKNIMIHDLPKAFAVYCVTFVAIFFGCFIRFPKHLPSASFHDRFKIVNIEAPFDSIYTRNYTYYRDLAFFFMILVILAISFVVKTVSIPSLSWLFFVACFFPLLISLFCIFNKQSMNNAIGTRSLVFLCLSSIFAALGVPPVIAIVDMTYKLISPIFVNNPPPQYKLLSFLSIAVFAFLVAFLVGYGTSSGTFQTTSTHINKNGLVATTGVTYDKKNWATDDDARPLLTFIAVLITMAVSLFMAFSVRYPLASTLYNILAYFLQIIIDFLAPLAMLVLVLVQFVLAYQNYSKTKFRADG